MLADIILNLSTGYENKYPTIQSILNNEYYDCCIQVGSENINQSVLLNNEKISLSIIPQTIFHNIPCLIGLGCPINIDKYNKDINKLTNLNIDLDRLIFIEENSTLIYKDNISEFKSIQQIKLNNICSFIPTLISHDDFINSYTRPLYLSSNGYFTPTGKNYLNGNINKCTYVKSIINPRIICNIIGVINIFQIYKNQNKFNIDEIYTICNTYENNYELFYNDLLLSYNWFNIDKIKEIIISQGINILYIQGKILLEDLDKLYLIENDKLIDFDDNKTYLEYISFNLLNIDCITDVIII